MSDSQKKMYFFSEFSDQFDERMNMNETNRRIHIIFNQLIQQSEVKNKQLLDAGCGTGWFSQEATNLGAKVTSMDLSESLLNIVKTKCDSNCKVGSILDIPFPDQSFDYVLNTEVIEHTTNPYQAFCELTRVLKPGGVLVLTVPNRVWKFSVITANLLRLRPYRGLENWVGYNQIRNWAQECNLSIEQHFGFNPLPFFGSSGMKLNIAIDKIPWIPQRLKINIALRARKKLSS